MVLKQGEYRLNEDAYSDLMKMAEGSLTDMSAIEELVKRSQERELYLKTIIDTVQDAFIVIHDNKIKDANDVFLNQYGYTRDDLASVLVTDIIAEEFLPELSEKMERLFKNGHDFFESVNKRKDGSKFDAEISTAIFSSEPFVSVCFIRDITERKAAENKLRHSHELMRYIIEHNRMAVAIHDKDLKFMYVSRPYIELFALEDKEIIGKHHYELFPNMPQEARDVHQRALKGEILHDEGPSVAGSGAIVRWECRPWYEEDGTIGGFVLYIEDITETRRFEELLINEKEHFKTTLLSVSDGVISTDPQGRITVMNPIAEKLTGWVFEKAAGKQLEDVLQIINEHIERPEEDYIKQVLEEGIIIEYGSNKLIVSKAGDKVPVEISIAPIKDSDGDIAGAVIIIRDFTEKRAKQRQIEFLSYNDALTGLYNRRYMEESLNRLDTPENLPMAIITIDVNGLKLTNDAFGHEMGDQLLKTVAGILKIICGPDDIIGRMGGDEFCIILKRTEEVQAAALRQRILNEVAQLKLEPVVVSLAIGVAVKTSPNQDIKKILKASDDNMYQDKIKYGKLMRSQTIQMALENLNMNYEPEKIHTERVSGYCAAIAEALHFPEKEIGDVKTAGALHDIGMVMVPVHVLKKPDKLTRDEYDLVKRHPEIGYQMLKMVDEYLHLSEFILYHHERWDGSGYPIGLKGKNIPLYSRIIALADAYEAMTASRPYRKIKTKEEAIAELKRCAGTQFDPELVEVFTEKVL